MDKLGDWIERLCSKPLALPVFLGLAAAGWFGDWIEPSNYLISVFTVALLLVTMGRDRRDRLAVQTKLDDLERSLPEASTENVRLEDQPEEEIEARRG